MGLAAPGCDNHPMTSRNTSARPPKDSPGPSRSWHIPRFVWLLLLLAVLLVVYRCMWIDRKIRRDFEALQWALPARIYSRPVELYAGAHMNADDLVDYLQRLGYRRTSRVDRSGEYRVAGSHVVLRSRGFQFWDGVEPEVYVDLTFDGHHVARVQDAGGADVPLLRLEPVEIEQINPVTGEDRMPVALTEVPATLVTAVVAIEDTRFYRHHGIDPIGIARAMWANLRAGGIVQGGSTLTQQLIKNLYLDKEQTLRRKIEEAVMAVSLELHFSKEDILTAYFNEIFLGQDGSRGIHGFALASQYYFGRPLNELRLDEIALLAGIGRGASYYNPLRYPERALERRNVVLGRMHELGQITDKQFETAHKAKLQVREKTVNRNGYPSFMELVYANLKRDYNKEALRSKGLNIFTTLDVIMQSKMEARLDGAVARVERGDKQDNPLEAAVVITDANTGEVRALAGGRKRGYSGFNRALHAVRPIGSLVKPAVYLTALESKAFTLASVLADEEIALHQPNGEIWRPQNYDRETNGDVYFYDALQRSLNLATLDLGLKIGVDKVKATLTRLGYTGDAQPYPSFLLGAVDMTPLDVAQVYQTLASSGFRSPLRAVEAVTTADGQPLAFYGIATKQVADPAAVWLLEYALQGVFERGTAKTVTGLLGAHLPLAGKTGTTNDLRDSWFAGYGNDLVGVVWLGHDDNQETGLTGATGALQVWTTLMQSFDIEPRQVAAPEDIVWDQVPTAPARSAAKRDCGATQSLPFFNDAMPDVGISCEVNDGFFGRVIKRSRSASQ
jgi:penicillin-binding protein 1B